MSACKIFNISQSAVRHFILHYNSVLTDISNTVWVYSLPPNDTCTSFVICAWIFSLLCVHLRVVLCHLQQVQLYFCNRYFIQTVWNMIWDRYTTESVGTYFRTSDLAAFVEQTIQTKGFLLTLWNSCKDKQHRRTIVPILRPIRDNPCLSQSCERIVMCKRVCLRASCWVNLWYSMTKAWTCHPHTHTMGE